MPVTPSIGEDNIEERRERFPIILQAMRETYALVDASYPGALERPKESYAILTTNAYFLLSNAYKRARLAGANRTYDYKVAAMSAAAVMIVRPMRLMRSTLQNEELLRNANMDCATRLAAARIEVDLSRVDPDFVRRLHRATLGPIDLPSLSPYLSHFDQVVFAADYNGGGSTFDDVQNAVPFESFNNVSLVGREMILVENLLNMFLLMKLAKGGLAPAQVHGAGQSS